jgi:hypothetical protein
MKETTNYEGITAELLDVLYALPSTTKPKISTVTEGNKMIYTCNGCDATTWVHINASSVAFVDSMRYLDSNCECPPKPITDVRVEDE